MMPLRQRLLIPFAYLWVGAAWVALVAWEWLDERNADGWH